MSTRSCGVEAVTRSADILGESPVWNMEEGALYWVDIRGRVIRRFDPVSGRCSSWDAPDLCCAIASAQRGMIVALGRCLYRFQPGLAQFEPLLGFEAEEEGNRLNEMRTDPRGRLWVGSMRDYARATRGSLYRVEPPGHAVRVLCDICVPNGLAWSPDGRTLYFADSADGRILAYAYDPDSGVLGSMRIVAGTGVLPGVVDGCAVDAEGCIWSARNGAGCVVGISPDGRIVDRLDLPSHVQPTACAFGGAALDVLFITTARQGIPTSVLQKRPLSGALFAARMSVKGQAAVLASL